MHYELGCFVASPHGGTGGLYNEFPAICEPSEEGTTIPPLAIRQNPDLAKRERVSRRICGAKSWQWRLYSHRLILHACRLSATSTLVIIKHRPANSTAPTPPRHRGWVPAAKNLYGFAQSA